jgi:transcriptional regulator with XRE-family HTH domain
MLRKRFGLALQSARHERGVSQEELAYRSNLQVSYISRIERGLQAPSLEAIAALATALGTRPHLLVMALRVSRSPRLRLPVASDKRHPAGGLSSTHSHDGVMRSSRRRRFEEEVAKSVCDGSVKSNS